MLSEKILVVNDDPNICELLRLYLEKEGYAVVIANDGESAVTVFKETNPSLVLLDIMLPDLTAGRSAERSERFPSGRSSC